MVQEQLVDYISSQIKLGVSHEAIKAALVSAGWVAGDVDDTFKKIDGGSPAVSMTSPTSATSTSSSMSSLSGVKPASASSSMSMNSLTIGSNPKTSQPQSSAQPQMIKVGDLVSSPFSGPAGKSPAMATTKAELTTATATKFGGTIKGNSFEAASAGRTVTGSSASGKGKVLGIVAIVLIVVFAGLAGYFFFDNASLASQITTLNNQSAAVTSQLNDLKSQVNASSSSNTAQIAALTATNQNLARDLSFYAVPPGVSASSAGVATPVTLSGSISGGGKAPYSVTTASGAKIFITSASGAAVMDQLKSIVGQSAQLSGTYVQGSDAMTVTSVSTSTVQ